MKTSVSSYSFAQYVSSGKMTQFDCVSKAKEMGFDAIEFTNIITHDGEDAKTIAKKIRDEADRVGIDINAYTISACLYQETDEDSEKEVARLKEQLEIAKILGAKVMRHDVCYKLGTSGNSRSFDLMLPTIAKNARMVTEYAETLGIKTCTENHGFIAQDSYRVEKLFNSVAHDNYGLLVDVGNFLCADEDPITAVSRVAPYAFHAHVKDFRFSKTPFDNGGLMTRGANYLIGCTIGEGIVPVKQCLAILKRAGYDGYISLEYEGTEDCMLGISRGLENIKKYLSEI